MIFYIDIYNLLHAHFSHISKTKRDEFINNIICYAQKTKYHIYIVFDGGASFAGYQENYHCYSFVYSGQQRTADDYIIEKVNTNKQNQEIVVVTYDRELLKKINQKKYIQMEPEAFVTLINKYYISLKKNILYSKKGYIKKMTEFEDNDLDNMMNNINKIPSKEDLQEINTNKENKTREDKKANLLINKLFKKKYILILSFYLSFMISIFASNSSKKTFISEEYKSYSRSELRQELFELCLNLMRICSKQLKFSTAKDTSYEISNILDWIICIYDEFEINESSFTKKHILELLENGYTIKETLKNLMCEK